MYHQETVVSGSIADKSWDADHGLAGDTLGIAALGERELRARLAAGRHRGDLQADALVARFRELPGGAGWGMFERALEHGADAVEDAPGELRALLEHASRTPSWLDLDLVDAGATSFWRVGLPALAPSLIYGSLAFGYQYGDLSRPLAATGRLEQMAPRRLGETSRWVLAVTTPGAMAPGGEGWRSSLRVRLVHALVRRHLLDSEEWDVEAWGVPISASAMMATAIGGFAIVPQRALADVGADATAADLESRTALWRWVGYVMGVPSALLPGNWREAGRLIETLATFDLGPNDDGPALMRALTHHALPLEGLFPAWGVPPARVLLTPMIEALAPLAGRDCERRARRGPQPDRPPRAARASARALAGLGALLRAARRRVPCCADADQVRRACSGWGGSPCAAAFAGACGQI
jgi:hypothetical protein